LDQDKKYLFKKIAKYYEHTEGEREKKVKRNSFNKKIERERARLSLNLNRTKQKQEREKKKLIYKLGTYICAKLNRKRERKKITKLCTYLYMLC
jgi:hypothetical protein